MDIIEIDTIELEDAWRHGYQRFYQDSFESVSRACAEGAEVARQEHIYENRTGDLTESIGIGDRFVLSATLIEGEIVASMRYASFVNEWEESKRGDGFMDKAADKAERVLEAGIEVAAVVLEHNVNSR